jgi:hypothetical protein
MVAGMSKRQQFRNERALQDLIRSVPGNDRCADCEAMNPGKSTPMSSSLHFSGKILILTDGACLQDGLVGTYVYRPFNPPPPEERKVF